MDKYKNYNEDFVSWLWENKYFTSPDFKTVAGQNIRLIYRGNRNHDAGPDFKHVTLDIDNQIVNGALEIHIDSAEWYQHSHHTNSVYNQVVLHLVMKHGDKEAFSRSEDGRKIPILILSDYLSASLETLFHRFQHPLPLDMKCPLHEKESAQILTLLDRAGAARLTLKGLAFRELRSFNSWDQILYLGMMEALGYAKNQIPFRKLAAHLPIEFIMRELRSCPEEKKIIQIQGLLFGAAGLLPAQNRQQGEIPEPETRRFNRQLSEIWEDFRHRIGLDSMHIDEWRFFRLRPQNFPTRRLAGMCRLLAKFCTEGFYAQIMRVFTGLSPNLDQINLELEQMLTCPAYDYWTDHYQFDSARFTQKSKKSAGLIGADRARDMVINIIFPLFLLSSYERGDGKLESTVKECYRRFPLLAENSITREMAKKLFPQKSQTRRLINSAQKQQGLIYLSKNFCHQEKHDECLLF